MGELEKRQELAPEKVALLAAMGIQVWHARPAAITSAHAGGEQQGVEQRRVVAEPAESHPHTSPQNSSQPFSQRGPSSSRSSSVGAEALRALREESSNTPIAAPIIAPPVTVSEPHEAAKPAVAAIEFAWVKGTLGMVFLAPAASSDMVQLVKDIVVYGDWLQQRRTAGSNPEGKPGRSATGDFRWPQLLDTGGTPARALSVFIDKHLPNKLDQGRGWVAVAEEVANSVTPWLQDLPVDVIQLPALHAHMGDAAIKRQIWSSLKSRG